MRRFERQVSPVPVGSRGMSLGELLLMLVVMGLLAALAFQGSGRALARLRVEAAARQLAVALEQARSSAERTGQPCALSLKGGAWDAAELPPCQVLEAPLAAEVTVDHNLPGALRISSNGLVLDGGTVVIRGAGTSLQRCLVVSLPLGVVRMGRGTTGPGAVPRSSDCVVDPSL